MVTFRHSTIFFFHGGGGGGAAVTQATLGLNNLVRILGELIIMMMMFGA